MHEITNVPSKNFCNDSFHFVHCKMLSDAVSVMQKSTRIYLIFCLMSTLILNIDFSTRVTRIPSYIGYGANKSSLTGFACFQL